MDNNSAKDTMELQSAPKIASPLLGLPREIRDQIYAFFFSNRPDPSIQYCGWYRHGGSMYYEYNQDEINLRMTCQQILHETHDALYKYNTIELSFCHLGVARKLPAAIRSLKLSSGFDGSDLCACRKATRGYPPVECGPPGWLNRSNMKWKDRLPGLQRLHLDPGYFATGDDGCKSFWPAAQRRLQEMRKMLEMWNPGCKVTVEGQTTDSVAFPHDELRASNTEPEEVQG